jgi:SAM-dependent methyltransferase
MLDKLKEKKYNLKKYSSSGREAFYQIAKNYLPEDEKSVVIDIGAGDGDFADYVLIKRFSGYCLLDGNGETVNKLKERYSSVVEYKAPEKMPFGNSSVDFIHCSHLVEHLNPEQLYLFLLEVDRVLKDQGIFVISTPMLWDRFYNDLSHIKPYNSTVFEKYLCKRGENYSNQNISKSYLVLEKQYRYKKESIGKDIFSEIIFVDILLKLIFVILNKFKIRKYLKNGYTLVLKK